MSEETSLQVLGAALDGKSARALAPAEVYHAFPYGIAPEANTQKVPLSHYLWILRRHRWKILGFVGACLLATAVVSTRLTPVYEATATVDVDRQTPSGIVGQEAVRSMLNDSDQFLATQLKLVQSDSVLRPVVEQYRLRDVEGEFEDVPPQDRGRAMESPVLLQHLKVTRPPNTYLLLINYRSTDPGLAANVANAVAKSYLEHTYNIRIRSSASLSAFMEKQLEELKAKMERSGSALAQFERELNVINPEEKTSILSARLLQLNNEYTNAQTDRVRKESAFNSVRAGTLEAAQVSTQGEALKKLMERLEDAQQKFAEVKTHFGFNHPEYRKTAVQLSEVERQLQAARENTAHRVQVEFGEAVSREAMLKRAVAETKAEFDRLNARSFEYQALKREAEADKKLYEELVRKIKEAGINAGFQNSSIRIADAARPPLKPVFPNLPLNLGLALLLSTLAAVGAATLADMLNNTVRDPEELSRTLKIDVVGSLPVVKDWRSTLIPGAVTSTGVAVVPQPKIAEQHLTGFDEAIRTLRNSILLSDFDRRLRTLMITSSAPVEGKSTIAAHLAAAHAQQGRRTLIIDADLRRPSVHRRFALQNATGLSNVLNGETGWRDAIIHGETASLDVLLAGPPSRRAADLVGASMAAILEEAAREYDLVIVDSPPLLGFPEPLQMSAWVDGVLLVALSGQTKRQALTTAVATLGRVRANIVGIVLNSVRADSSESYYYHYYHPNYYKHYQAEA